MKSLQAIICLSASSRISFLFYGLAIICLNTAASNGGNETDYLSLLSFKSMIAQDPYQVLTSWNHSFHFCEWSGVSCGKRHKRVIALILESQGLEGSLSPHVGNLSFLRELSLSRTTAFKEPFLMNLVVYLGYAILILVCNITSMEEFSAVGNPLGGSIPDTLGLWKSLTAFVCGECNLYGSIPHSIFNLTLLVNFSLAENHLPGSLPSQIDNQLPNLELLHLRNNELTGVLPPSISNCSKLVILEMSENNFSGKLTIDFSKLRDIYLIILDGNNFHGRGEADDTRFIDSLKNCTRLRVLELHYCNLIGVLPVSIGNLSDQLTFLHLEGNQLFGSLPSSIANLVGLSYLVLASNQFKGKIPTTVGKLQKLQFVALFSNQFSGRP
ncbi:kinase-like domain-containing protein [Tanacetum coccineum]